MAWCTKCKKEYSDEFSSCPNCNTNPQSTSALGSELMDSLKPYAFKEDFTMQDLVDDLEDTDGIPKSAKLYKSARDYYADARSTAFAFFFIGFLGLAATISDMVGIINFPLPGLALYTMTIIFAVFVLICVYSMRRAKKYFVNIQEEDALANSIKKWYYTAEMHSDEKENHSFPQKYERIRVLLKNQFPNVDEAFLDKLAADFSGISGKEKGGN